MISEIIQKVFIQNGWTLATAESCTGGNIAHQITLNPGSSEYFVGSVVSYSNNVKKNVLGVNSEDLKQFGAVSEQVAIQMASGVRKLMQTDFAISSTGIAGPTGGTSQKPVGTVWIGIASYTGTFAKKFQFYGDRESVINQTTKKAFEMLLNEVPRQDSISLKNK